MKNELLKPCPHCGGKAFLNSNYSRRAQMYFVFVKCDICGAQGKAYRSYIDPSDTNWTNQACMDAAAAWNMRTDDQEAEREEAKT